MICRRACALFCVVAWGCVHSMADAQPLFGPPAAAATESPSLAVPSEQLPSPPLPSTGQAPVSVEILPIPPDAKAVESLPTAPSTDLQSLILEDQPSWYAPNYWTGPTPWETSIEFGLNGSSGTSDSLSIQAGSTVLRESRFSKLNLDSKYNRTTKSGAETQNNAELDVRNDWMLDDKSPWTLYATGNLFYDQFQTFDLQANANTGLGYRFVHNPALELMSRFGGGASREIGGPDDRWVPESLLGVEYMQRFSALQKLTAKIDYYPEWEEIGEFRLLADIAWEVALVQPSNMSLKISASDRYDSTPGGAEAHLVNYSVLLMIKM